VTTVLVLGPRKCGLDAGLSPAFYCWRGKFETYWPEPHFNIFHLLCLKCDALFIINIIITCISIVRSHRIVDLNLGLVSKCFTYLS